MNTTEALLRTLIESQGIIFAKIISLEAELLRGTPTTAEEREQWAEEWVEDIIDLMNEMVKEDNEETSNPS